VAVEPLVVGYDDEHVRPTGCIAVTAPRRRSPRTTGDGEQKEDREDAPHSDR
jgi:hypothetical protein